MFLIHTQQVVGDDKGQLIEISWCEIRDLEGTFMITRCLVPSTVRGIFKISNIH